MAKKISKKSVASAAKENQGAVEIKRMPLRKGAEVSSENEDRKRILGHMAAQTRIISQGFRSRVESGLRAASTVKVGSGVGTGSYGGTGGGGVAGGGYGGGGLGGYGGGIGNSGVAGASAGNFYSPELSTDFLELPQSVNEQWNYYRFFYANEPFVGQAIDLHTDIPISKVRLAPPVCENEELGRQCLAFCEDWAEDVGLVDRLLEILHEYNLIGEAFIWCEDRSPDMPREVTHDLTHAILDDGTPVEEWVERDDMNERAVEWLSDNYKGWTSIRCLPPEQVHLDTFPFTDAVMMEMIPDGKTKHVLEQAQEGDPRAQKIVDSMDPVVVKAIREGENIPLNTDPNAGSFVYYLANKRSSYAPRGSSILQRCMRTIVYFDKLRQAQTSIASRHMTPIRLVYAEDMDAADTDALRDQVDLALQDPDYSIVTNFQVTWEEMNSNGRILELSSEYDLVSRQLYAGLGVTESLLSGESSYAGDRINLEVLNTRYLLIRERFQRLVEHQFLKPMCRRMGFVEKNKYGNLKVIYPRLQFTRLALRDNQDTFDALFNLYQKGSLDVETIYDVLGLDSNLIAERLKNDLFTIKDSQFNRVLDGLYGRLGDALSEQSDAVEKVAEYLGLDYTAPKDDSGGRF